MKLSNKFIICAISACSLLAGCGSKSSSHSDKSPSAPAADTPATPTFSVSSCEAVTDPGAVQQLESAKANIVDILRNLNSGDFHTAQVFSAQTKATFKAVLDKYPNSCEAQLGYALGIVADLVNNNEIKAFIDTVSNKQDLLDMDVNDFNRIFVTTDGKLLTSMAQSAMAQAIPSLDSAIIYMRSVVNNKDFTCNYTYEDRTFELDRGEFAPALGALFVAKSVLTFGASLNIDFSNNGKYDWLNDLYNDNYGDEIKNSTAKQVIALMDKGSSFSTVYGNWKSNYRDIPNLLDSAISYVELGLLYGIEESATGIATQINDPYVVGDDEMSDVSAADFQKAIDSLEYYRGALRTGVEITLPAGSKVTVNVAKFFEITDGFQDYLPYHKFNNAETWNTPVDGFYWSTEISYYSYAKAELVKPTAEALKDGQIGELDIWVSLSRLCIDGEIQNSYLYKCYSMTSDNCTISFAEDGGYSYGSDIAYVPGPVKLSSNVCKVENGVSLFANAYNNTVPNAFYFTDASGKKTISYQALVNGKLDDSGYFKDYTLDDMKNFIFFPDVTFGGVLPGMTADRFWSIIIAEKRYDDEEDDWDATEVSP